MCEWMQNTVKKGAEDSAISMGLQNKNILLGVSGGIAAYKAAEIVRLLVKAEATVRVVMTTNAQEFMTPLTLQSLSRQSGVNRYV